MTEKGRIAGATEKRGSGRTGGEKGEWRIQRTNREWPGRNSGKRGDGDGGPADKTGVARLMGKEGNGGPADKTGVAPIKSGAHLL